MQRFNINVATAKVTYSCRGSFRVDKIISAINLEAEHITAKNTIERKNGSYLVYKLIHYA